MENKPTQKRKISLEEMTPEQRKRYLARRKQLLLKKKQQQRRKQMLLFGGAAAAFLLILFLLVFGISAIVRTVSGKRAEKQAAEQQAMEQAQKEAAEQEAKRLEEEEKAKGRFPEPVSLTISVVGDCTFGIDNAFFDYETSTCQYYDDYGPEYFMQNVKSIFEKDDLTIANLECTLTEAEVRNENHYFCFKAPKEYTSILTTSSIEAVTTANNHSQDFLDEGYQDTLAALDQAGIVNFGYQKTAMMEVKGVKIGLVGTYELIEHEGIATEMKDNIQKLRQDGADIVIVIVHWGNELDLIPDSTQTFLAHTAIDAGADLVCGHHAHVLQGMETYKGKNILYGLANFCFGGNQYPNDMDSIIYQQTFTVSNDGVKADNVTNIIPVRISSDYYVNNYQPTVQEGEEASRILAKFQERTSWLGTGAPASESEDYEESYDESEDYDYDSDYDEEY